TDIENEAGVITVFTPHTEYAKARQALTDALGDVDFEVDEIQFLPQTSTSISAEDLPMFERFIDMLNDVEDVQNIYHNAEVGSVAAVQLQYLPSQLEAPVFPGVIPAGDTAAALAIAGLMFDQIDRIGHRAPDPPGHPGAGLERPGAALRSAAEGRQVGQVDVPGQQQVGAGVDPGRDGMLPTDQQVGHIRRLNGAHRMMQHDHPQLARPRLTQAGGYPL